MFPNSNKYENGDLTWYYTFKDPVKQNDYFKYQIKCTSLWVTGCNVIFNVWNSINYGDVYLQSNLLRFVLACRIITGISWLLIALVLFESMPFRLKSFVSKFSLSPVVLADISLITSSCQNGLTFIYNCTSACTGDNIDPNGFYSLSCNPDYLTGIPKALYCYIFVLYIVVVLTTPAHHWIISMLSGLILLICVIVGAVIVNDLAGSKILIMLAMGCLLFIFHMENDRLTQYITSINLQGYISAAVKAENGEYLSKVHAADMKVLIGNIAHDLKTPLQGLVSNLESIEKALHTNGNSEDSKGITLTLLESSLSMCNFMSMAVNRAIDFSKASANVELSPKHDITDLNSSILWAANCIRDFSNVPIAYSGIADQYQNVVITDEHWLKENILCLLTNAVKYSLDINKQVGISCRVEVDDTGDKAVLVAVEDKGIGVPPEKHQHLFKPFQRFNSTVGGTGLGLFSLSRRLDALSGSYGMKNRDDGLPGSCFWFKFPYVQGESVSDTNVNDGSVEMTMSPPSM
jgi:signal transduction histidine kinase